jgi:hypothetical protein
MELEEEPRIANDQAGHGGMQIVKIGNADYRKKSTTCVEAYVYARLVMLCRNMKDAPGFMPEVLKVSWNGQEYDLKREEGCSTFIDLCKRTAYLGNENCTIWLRDLTGQIEERFGLTCLQIPPLDVKIGGHTFSNAEAEFRKGKGESKPWYNRLQMTISETMAGLGGSSHYLIARGNVIERQLNYAYSKENLQEFVKGCSVDVVQFNKLMHLVLSAKLALIGSSILLFKAQDESSGEIRILPFLIDPAHGFFMDEVTDEGPDWQRYIDEYQTGFEAMLEDIREVSKKL